AGRRYRGDPGGRCTGNVGRELVRILAADGERVLALTRDPVTAAVPSGATAVGGDLNDPGSLTDALAGVRAMFLLSGYRDLPILLERAGRLGVERVVLLSGSAATARDTDNAVSGYMLASESAVRGCGLAWTILRPVSFMSNTLQWARQMRVGDTVRVPFAAVPAAVIDPFDIAAVAGIALRSGAHDARAYTLTGPEALSPADRLRQLSAVLGRRLRLVEQSNEQARAEMAATTPADYVHAFFRFYAEGMLDEATPQPTVAEITGRPPRTFREWAQAHRAAFAY
ncbi:MAG TPA: NAD(P)H-binding protein, partial [Streptosporangiales bacterium]